MNSSAPVILLHGFAQTARSWDDVVSRLQAAGHATIVPDLYGAQEGYLLRDMNAVCAYVDMLATEVAKSYGDPILVGYSMGGRIAAETLVRRGRALPLAGLVLESAGLGPLTEEGRAAIEERNNQWAEKLNTQGVAAFMDFWETLPLFESQKKLPGPVRASIRDERLNHSADELAKSLTLWGAHCQHSEEETLGSLAEFADRAPALYLAGSLDAKYSETAARVEACGVKTDIIEGVGHNVHLEKPDAFVEAILSL